MAPPQNPWTNCTDTISKHQGLSCFMYSHTHSVQIPVATECSTTITTSWLLSPWVTLYEIQWNIQKQLNSWITLWLLYNRVQQNNYPTVPMTDALTCQQVICWYLLQKTPPSKHYDTEMYTIQEKIRQQIYNWKSEPPHLWLNENLWLRGLVKSNRRPSKSSGFRDTSHITRKLSALLFVSTALFSETILYFLRDKIEPLNKHCNISYWSVHKTACTKWVLHLHPKP